jgi:hypothetical protein
MSLENNENKLESLKNSISKKCQAIKEKNVGCTSEMCSK